MCILFPIAGSQSVFLGGCVNYELSFDSDLNPSTEKIVDLNPSTEKIVDLNPSTEKIVDLNPSTDLSNHIPSEHIKGNRRDALMICVRRAEAS